MANCCVNGLNQVFCNAFNKYYNTLYTNGEISKEETNNLLIIDYIRQCLSDDRYNSYYNILLKALRCIANNSCLLDTSWLYDRSIVPKVTNQFVTILTKQAFVETDPVFSASPAATITDEDIENWNNPSASGALIVTVTLDGTYSADKTFAEMLTAWNNGQDVIVYYSDAVYQVSWIDDGGAWFFRTDKTNAGPYIDYFAVDGTDDSWTKNTYNLQERLTSGTNIKTINSSSILGSGNVDLLTPNFCPIIEDTRSQATDVNITGTAPFATLAGGQRIVLHFKYANTASPTLQLTLSDSTITSAYPLYQNYNNGVNVLTLQAMPAGSFGEFVFDSTNSRWVLVGKDYNTTYSNTSQADINNSAQGSRLIEPKLLRDNFYLKSEVNNICPIIEDTRSSAVAAITGVAPFSTLVDGQRIILLTSYQVPTNATLTLTLSGGTTTSAIPMYIASYNSSPNTAWASSVKAETYLDLIYESANSRWVMVGQRDTNTTYGNIGQSTINAGTETSQKTVSALIMHDNCYIVEETYSSGSLKANKMYDFGTVSSALTIPSLDATNDLVSNALNFYALRFIAGADNLSITFPTGVEVDDTPTINTGDYVEIMINKYGSNFYASIKVWQAQ